MGKIAMVIEYDGSQYHGIQVQNNAHTVQAEVEHCIYCLTGEKVSILFAGRTDAGVHAWGQVIAFDTNATIPAPRWKPALNSFLPADIKVVKSAKCLDDFHPQYMAVEKEYIYRIYRRTEGSVFYRNYALCNTEPLDIEAMQKACLFIEGCHNFKAFCASGSTVKNHERMVYRCQIVDEEPFLNLKIEANGFLYNMVRIIMGTILAVGRGRYPPEKIVSIIKSQDRSQAGATVPPQGLYLSKVIYPEKYAF